jgi:hypothetical protein
VCQKVTVSKNSALYFRCVTPAGKDRKIFGPKELREQARASGAAPAFAPEAGIGRVSVSSVPPFFQIDRLPIRYAGYEILLQFFSFPAFCLTGNVLAVRNYLKVCGEKRIRTF